jgi:hypothetical protein
MITCRTDVLKAANVDQHLVHIFAGEIPRHHRY